jgi:hypothetical protein
MGFIGFVIVGGLMGLLVVPFTVKGIFQFLFDPVVLRALRAAIADPDHYACELKVDGVRGLVVYDGGICADAKPAW